MNIESCRLGPAGRHIIALLQRPKPGQAHRGAFLLCRPLGQEAIRTAAIYRTVSDRLAREGCTVLVFDAHGCGDSPGEPDLETFQTWTGDLLAADAHLRGQVGSVPVHWFGMGLGANLALRAARHSPSAPQCLIAWEPILDGPAYLQRLLDAHRRELSRELDQPWPRLVARGIEAEPSLPGSVLGFTIGPALHRELQQLHGLDAAALRALSTQITVTTDAPHQAALANTLRETGVTVQAVEQTTDWMSTEALGTAIVPPDILQTLLRAL